MANDRVRDRINWHNTVLGISLIHFKQTSVKILSGS